MAEEQRDPGLHRKLVWLTLFRLVTVTVLLGGTAFVSLKAGGEADAGLAPLYRVVIATLRRLGGHSAWPSAGAPGWCRPPTPRSPSTWGSRRWWWRSPATARASSSSCTAGGGERRHPAVPPRGAHRGRALGGGPTSRSRRRVPRAAPLTLFVHSGAFLITAALASYLAEQLRSTGERLAESESDLDVITALHEAIVDSMPGGLVTLDAAGDVTYANRAAEQIDRPRRRAGARAAGGRAPAGGAAQRRSRRARGGERARRAAAASGTRASRSAGAAAGRSARP